MKPGRLLLADRHLGVLGGAHGLLHDLFDTVTMVADERSLMQAVADFCPDLVVMDLSLHWGQEVDLVGQLKACHPDLRLVVLSVHDDASVADRFFAAGVAGFVVKRAVGTDLLPAVRAALAGGTYVSPAVQAGCDKSQARRSDGTPSATP